MGRQRVTQVNDVAHLSVLEQRGIALGCNLQNLPLHWGQKDFILTSMHVGSHHLAVDGGMYCRLVFVHLVVGLMRELLVKFFLALVLVVPHQT